MQDNCGLWLAVVMSRDRQVVELPSLETRTLSQIPSLRYNQ
jgi:hypothetical protein